MKYIALRVEQAEASRITLAQKRAEVVKALREIAELLEAGNPLEGVVRLKIYKLQANTEEYQTLSVPDKSEDEILRSLNGTPCSAGWTPIKVAVWRVEEELNLRT